MDRAPCVSLNDFKLIILNARPHTAHTARTLAPHASTHIYTDAHPDTAPFLSGGSRFARHIDNTTGDGRRLTLLIYLNPHWTEELGGALRLTPPKGPPVDVYPMGGRLAMFYSAECPHEVMPTYGDRHAITLW